jgi:cellulose synthase (UDP-forming)
MKKTLLLLMAFASLIIVNPQVQASARTPLDLGVYDATHAFDKSSLRYEQIWVSWADYTPGKLLPKLQAIVAKGRTPILSIDPYAIKTVGSSSALLEDIVKGKYDAIINELATEIQSLGKPVIVRWGPEMERDIAKPWSAKPVTNFIAAYRHFVNTFRTNSTALQMWSPIGNEGCTRYYPGADVVDIVGFSIYEIPACSIKWCGHPRSFAQWMDIKYPAMAQFGKPIIIAESGICDIPANQASWVHDALGDMYNYPLVTALIYYNAFDPVSWKPWGGPAKTDWTINPTVFVE